MMQFNINVELLALDNFKLITINHEGSSGVAYQYRDLDDLGEIITEYIEDYGPEEVK